LAFLSKGHKLAGMTAIPGALIIAFAGSDR
jgi:hypothetical protein